jgi:FkbM family methyltransferase
VVSDYFKSALVRTPLEGVAVRAVRASDWVKSRLHPGLRELLLESARVERVGRQLIRRDSNCVDVGCHLGSMLSLFVRLAPQGRHAAYEPVPRKAAWLRRKFPDVTVRELALGESAGRVTFFESLTRSGFSGLGKTGDPRDVVNEITVDCARLDDVSDVRPVSFLKVDVEGAEYLVLRGAEGVLLGDRPALLFESVPGAGERFGHGHRELFEYLNGPLGYSVYLPVDFLERRPPLDWVRFDASHRYPFRAMNYVAVPR